MRSRGMVMMIGRGNLMRKENSQEIDMTMGGKGGEREDIREAEAKMSRAVEIHFSCEEAITSIYV